MTLVIMAGKNGSDFANKFKNDPVKAIEEASGMDLPEEQINQVVGLVKTKINLDNNSGIAGKITGLFNK